MKRYIVGLGEALWDVLPEGKKLGGAPANFAYHAGQFGLDTIAISALGEDPLADETIKAFEEHDLAYLMPRVPFPTGTVQVTLSGEGIPSYEIKEGVAWDNIPFTPEMEAIANSARAVCFGSLAQRNEVSRDTIRKFLAVTPADCMIICDINLRQQFYSKEILEDSFRLCNVLKINDEELVVVNRMFGYDSLDMSDTCKKIVSDYGLKMLVLTCGTNGSYVFTDDGLTSFRTHRRWRLLTLLAPEIPSREPSAEASSTERQYRKPTRQPYRSVLLFALRMGPCRLFQRN